jgi:hypothetical protein
MNRTPRQRDAMRRFAAGRRAEDSLLSAALQQLDSHMPAKPRPSRRRTLLVAAAVAAAAFVGAAWRAAVGGAP